MCVCHSLIPQLSVIFNLKVAYHGVPDKAYEVFVYALHSHYLSQNFVIPGLEDHNPAGKYKHMSVTSCN